MAGIEGGGVGEPTYLADEAKRLRKEERQDLHGQNAEIKNLLLYHGFSIDDVIEATGYSRDKVEHVYDYLQQMQQ